jgi:hypothetical protein
MCRVGVTVGGRPAFASPVGTASLELQADTTDEVVVQISGVPPSCGPAPAPAPAGLLIDDLRLE